MAFTSTKFDNEGHYGSLRVTCGKYVNDSDSTGGDIATGLNYVISLLLQPWGSAVVANQGTVTETMPKANDGITVKTNANESGSWIAYGQ